jgi:AcrR family transcriptional regulator
MDAPARPMRGVRQRRAAETRARIFAAATELFSQRGYQATTIDSISARAGVAKGTFFVHFPSKDAVITALVRIQTTAARKARARVLEQGKGPIEALRAAVMALGEQAALDPTLSRGVLTATLASQEVGGEAAALFDEVFAEMVTDATAAAKARLLASHVSPDTLAASLIASYLGALLHFTSSPRTQSLLDVLAPLVEANVAGALSRPPRRPTRKARKRRKG